MDDIVTYLNNVGVYNWDKKMVEANLQDMQTKIFLINYLNVCLHGNRIVSITKNHVCITHQDQLLKEIIDATAKPVMSTKISKYVIPIAFMG